MNTSTHSTDPVTIELLGWIEASVCRLVASVEGLTEEQLRTPATPSGWSVLGLLGHVHDSTTFWLHNVVSGDPTALDEDDEWANDPPRPAAVVVEELLADVASACDAVRGVDSSQEPGWWPEGAWGGYRQRTVRGVLVHLLNDNAAHTGQLDIAREQIDGAVWDFTVNRVRQPNNGPKLQNLAR